MRKKMQSTKFIKSCLADALIKLLEQGYSFTEINVKDICALAGIGRTTYYRYFENKDGKENLILFKVFNAWEDYCVSRENELKESKLRVLINFLYENRNLLLLLNKHDLVSNALFKVFYVAVGPTPTDDKSKSYWKAFLAGSLYGIIVRWLELGFEDTPDYVFELLSEVYK